MNDNGLEELGLIVVATVVASVTALCVYVLAIWL